MLGKYSHAPILGAVALLLGLMNPAQGQVPLAKKRTVTIGSNQYILTSKLKKILIGNFHYNYDHTVGTPNLESTLKRVFAAASDSVTVDTVLSGGGVTTAKLTGYQVFFANYISSWASATGFPQAGRTAIQNFVEVQGGGVFIMHSSGDSKVGGNWPWFYNTAHPVNYVSESNRTDVSAPMFIPPATRASNHPILEGIGFGTSGTSDTFNVSQGEFHQFAKSITSVVSNPTLLINMNGALCKKANAGTNCGVATGTYSYLAAGGYPAAWTFPDMKGTIGYFMEAHDLVTMQAMSQPMWDKFFKQFMYWMAGYDTLQVGIVGVHTPEPDFALSASGITFHPTLVGVLISTPGFHTVTLYDLAGHVIQEMKGRRTPVDYSFDDKLKGAKSGVYVLRVAVAGRVASKRFFVR